MRPIDADAAIQWVEENECYTDKFKRIMEGVIDEQPTVDAVAVTRCGECAKWKHEKTENHDFYRCEKGNHWSKKKNDDWFCADGERRSDGKRTARQTGRTPCGNRGMSASVRDRK